MYLHPLPHAISPRHRRAGRWSWSLLALALSSGPGVWGDEILLQDGTTVEGTILAESPETVSISIGYGSITATRHVRRSEIGEIHRGLTARQKRIETLQIERGALLDPAAAGTSTGARAADLWKLSERARVLEEDALRRDLARDVIALDPDHGDARRLLGFVQQDGIWMTKVEAAKARGEVFFRKRWMTVAERDGILADEAAADRQEEEDRRKELDVRKAEAELRAKEAEVRRQEAAAAQAEAAAQAAVDRAAQPGLSVGVWQSLPPETGGWYGGRWYPPVIIVRPDRPHRPDKPGKPDKPSKPEKPTSYAPTRIPVSPFTPPGEGLSAVIDDGDGDSLHGPGTVDSLHPIR